MRRTKRKPHRAGAAGVVLAALAGACAAATADEPLYLGDGTVYLDDVTNDRTRRGKDDLARRVGLHRKVGLGNAPRRQNRRHPGGDGVQRRVPRRRALRTGTGEVPDGRTREGAWRAGMRQGEGVETLRNGLARWCTWRWDVIVWDSCTAAKAQETQGPQSNRR